MSLNPGKIKGIAAAVVFASAPPEQCNIPKINKKINYKIQIPNYKQITNHKLQITNMNSK